jgi:hypothetical protein
LNYGRKQFWACHLFAPPRNESKIRTIYLRITIDRIPKETSTKRKWDISRWDQKLERAIGTKEDAKSFYMCLESFTLKINEYKTENMYNGKLITAQKVMDYILGRNAVRVKVLEEFQKHNDEMTALLGKGYAKGTLDRFTITINHVIPFIRLEFNAEDLEFSDFFSAASSYFNSSFC